LKRQLKENKNQGKPVRKEAESRPDIQKGRRHTSKGEGQLV